MSQATAVIAPVKNSFPSPYEQPAPVGAEGWKDLYAYNLVFQDNRRDVEEAKFWFCDSQHWPTVTKPFETIGFEFAVGCLGQYNSRQLLIPTANGIEYRIHHQVVHGNIVMNERTDVFTMKGRTIELPVMGVFEIADGKIASLRDYFDMTVLASGE